MGLAEILENRPDILDDKKKLKSTFSDYFAGDEAMVRRMMNAYNIGILSSLISHASDFDLEKKRLIDILVQQYDMQESKANHAVEQWYLICPDKVIKSYKKYIQDKEDAHKKERKKAIKRHQDAQLELKEQQKKEKDEILKRSSSQLIVDTDNYERYMNLDLSKGEIVRGLPCGVGNHDHGFEIVGIGRQDINNNDPYPSLVALVYNFLIRDTHITREAYPQYMKKGAFNHELDYGHVYRFMMLLIEMVEKPGENVVRLNVIGDKDELKAAVDILNEYLGVFGRLTKSAKYSLKVICDQSGRSISVETEADICVKSYTSDHGLRRRPRYGKRINYSLGKDNKEDLEFLLREISPFDSFKKGQFEALCSMMNANGHAVCIMPTGSGKSLIYYFACLLQPQIVFVVSPTDILIKDQIRNLRKIHYFDNVTHLSLQADNDYSFFKPATNLIFLTPTTFHNRNLFGVFMRRSKEISYVVLDEIHCLSNWGHDFRPEYLMLSKNMNQYLEDARYLGFTATANYTVAQDIQKQLRIPLENFFSPILFEKYNVRYDFREADDTEEMLNHVRAIAGDIISRNERAIVFTKSDSVAHKVADAIGYEADVFTKDETDGYSQFAEGYCRILVASDDLGIGINLPNVNCTVHFGIPLSKNEFVQEIGRAGRADEKVTAYVIYLKPSENNIPMQLLKRETVVDNLPQLLNAMNNDYSDAYHKLNCGADTSEVLYDRLVDVYSNFHSGKQVAYVEDHPVKTMDEYKQLLYMLYVTGYVKDWYTYRAVGNRDITLLIDICNINNTSGHRILVLPDEKMLERMKKISKSYFAEMGNDRESIYKVTKAKTHKEILHIYAKWYYEKFLYHHKEEFLDFFEFLIGNMDCDSLKITEEIEDYFTLPFIKIKEDEQYYSNMTFEEISDRVITGIGRNTLTNIERINSNKYSPKLDYLLLFGNWRRSGRFEANRVERVWDKLSNEGKALFADTMADIYEQSKPDGKWSCLRYLDDKRNVTGITLKDAVESFYKNKPKDRVYYGVLSAYANTLFKTFIRSK